MKISAERRSVVQNQGSRGFGAELILHRKMMKNRCKIHPQIFVKSMQNRCSKKLCQNEGKWRQSGAQMGAKIH